MYNVIFGDFFRPSGCQVSKYVTDRQRG